MRLARTEPNCPSAVNMSNHWRSDDLHDGITALDPFSSLAQAENVLRGKVLRWPHSDPRNDHFIE